MGGQDVVKLCYQAVFGAEHLLTEPETARKWLLEELNAVPARREPLWERISPDFVRVNLGAWKSRGLPVETLFELFRKTAAQKHGSEREFRALLAETLNTMPERTNAMRKAAADCLQDGIHPVHHSEAYRRAEQPAYRVVAREWLQTVSPVTENYIWDLDGTLLDSYPLLTDCLVDATRQAGVPAQRERVMTEIKQYMVAHFLQSWSEETGVARETLYQLYRQRTEETLEQIVPVAGALDALSRLKRDGARHFVYTHRSNAIVPLLRKLGMAEHFEEIVTSDYGLPLKPAPDGVTYLVEKYDLDPDHTYYVGDRTLDAGCAVNAGVRSIQYLAPDTCVQPTGQEDLIISDYRDL